MRALGLGVLLNAEYPAREIAELARLIEDLDYRSLWYSDVRMIRDCYIGLATIAMATKRLALGPGVTDPYSRHPVMTASSIGTLDELSDGRALLGLGVGGSGFRELGISAKLPVAALREMVDLVRRLVAGEEVTMEGKVVSATRARLQFSPPRERIPVYFATQGPQVMRLAGEIADGVLLANTVDHAAIAFYIEKLRAGAARTGRTLDEIDLCLRYEVCIDDDESVARSVMRRRITSRLINTYPRWHFLEHLGVELPAGFVQIAAAKDMSRIDEAMASLPDAVLDRSVLAGTAQQVVRRVLEMVHPEVRTIVIRPHAPAGRSVAGTLRKFSCEMRAAIAH